MDWGIQPTSNARDELVARGIAKTIDEKIRTPDFSVSVAWHNLAHSYESDLYEDWKKIIRAVEKGELTRALLGTDSGGGWNLHHAVFAYTLSGLADTRADYSRQYNMHSWTSGNYKTWIRNLDDDFILARANVSGSDPWINLDIERERPRVRELQTDWREWHRFTAVILSWAGQLGQAELVHSSFQDLDGEYRMSVEEAKKRGFLYADDLEYDLKDMFDVSLPSIKRGEGVPVDRFNFYFRFYGAGSNEGESFLPYIFDSGVKNLCFAMTPHHGNAESAIGKMKRRGKPLFNMVYRDEKAVPFWQHQTFSPDELPEMLTGIKKCYNGYTSHLWPVIEKALSVYGQGQQVAK